MNNKELETSFFATLLLYLCDAKKFGFLKKPLKEMLGEMEKKTNGEQK